MFLYRFNITHLWDFLHVDFVSKKWNHYYHHMVDIFFRIWGVRNIQNILSIFLFTPVEWSKFKILMTTHHGATYPPICVYRPWYGINICNYAISLNIITTQLSLISVTPSVRKFWPPAFSWWGGGGCIHVWTNNVWKGI